MLFVFKFIHLPTVNIFNQFVNLCRNPRLKMKIVIFCLILVIVHVTSDSHFDSNLPLRRSKRDNANTLDNDKKGDDGTETKIRTKEEKVESSTIIINDR